MEMLTVMNVLRIIWELSINNLNENSRYPLEFLIWYFKKKRVTTLCIERRPLGWMGSH